MNARDAIMAELPPDWASSFRTFSEPESYYVLLLLRFVLGWDGTGEPPVVVIMGDGTLERAEQHGRICGLSEKNCTAPDRHEPLYRLVDPEAEQDARALEALGPELLAHIDNMEAE